MTDTITPAPEAPPAVALAPMPTQLAAARPRQRANVWEAAASAIMAGDAPALAAALSDVVPADLGESLRPQWLGDLWDGDPQTRPMVDASTRRPLTGLKVQAPRWTATQAVGPWSGSKTAIPSNTAKATVDDIAPTFLAGGVDVARELVDLGSPELLRELMAQAVDDYRGRTEADHAAKVLAGATVDATDYASGVDALIGAVGQVLSVGQVSAVFVGISAWADIVKSGVGFDFLTGTVSLRDDQGTVGGLTFRPHGALAPAQVLAFDRRAVVHLELDPPVQVNAANVALGGLDQAVHGYVASYVRKQAAVALATVGGSG